MTIALPRVVQRPSANYTPTPIRHDLLIAHVMEGGYAGSVAWLCQRESRASVHLCMSEDGAEVSQLVPLQFKAWAQCAFNSAGVSLEMPGFTAQGLPEARWRAAALIFGWLCVAYDIPPVWARGGQGRGVCQHVDLGAAGGGHHDACGAKFYYPNYFANSATGLSQKLNRLQVGVEALSSSDLIAATPNQTMASWAASYVPVMASAQVASTSAIGAAAISGASRASDFRAWAGSSTGGPGVVAETSINDDLLGNAIMCGFCAFNFQLAGVTGDTVNQFDTMNQGSVLEPLPADGGVANGSTVGLLLTPGAKGGAANNNVSAALAVGRGSANNTTFEKGLIFYSTSLDTSKGSGGNGVSIDQYTGQSIRWMSATNTVHAEVWGNVNGLNVSKNLVLSGGATPTLATGTGQCWGAAVNGLACSGQGSSNDFVLLNKNSAAVITVLTGTTTLLTQNISAAGNIAFRTGTAIPAGGAAASCGLTMSSTASFGIFCGSGVPTLSAAQGSVYIRSDGSSTSTRLYINTNGTTGWTNVTTGV